MKTRVIEILIALGVVAVLCWKVESQQDEKKDLQHRLAHAQIWQPIEHDSIVLHDTIYETAKTQAITDELRSLRRQHLIDEQTIKAMGVKVKQLEMASTTTTVTKDSARADSFHSVSNVFSYRDEWTVLQFRLKDSTFVYSVRDSLITVIERIPKHRFLWWRWGVKGYNVRHVNLNPHSHIGYSRTVIPEK